MLYSKRYRFHHTLTERGSVAGVDINVSAPETFWAVIGVAVSVDSNTALCAGEIFNVALKFFVHWSVLTFLPCARWTFEKPVRANTPYRKFKHL